MEYGERTNLTPPPRRKFYTYRFQRERVKEWTVWLCDIATDSRIEPVATFTTKQAAAADCHKRNSQQIN